LPYVSPLSKYSAGGDLVLLRLETARVLYPARVPIRDNRSNEGTWLGHTLVSHASDPADHCIVDFVALVLAVLTRARVDVCVNLKLDAVLFTHRIDFLGEVDAQFGFPKKALSTRAITPLKMPNVINTAAIATASVTDDMDSNHLNEGRTGAKILAVGSDVHKGVVVVLVYFFEDVRELIIDALNRLSM
jgi:hypothetical protein